MSVPSTRAHCMPDIGVKGERAGMLKARHYRACGI